MPGEQRFEDQIRQRPMRPGRLEADLMAVGTNDD